MRTMARIPDTPKVARRREREKRTISNMVAIYCAAFLISSIISVMILSLIHI